MGIYGALSTAVTGLQAQSFALENISGNIANSQTIGYKRVDTSFEDMIPDGKPAVQNAGSVVAYSRATNNVEGDVSASQISTNMAINGQGFFVVEQRTGDSDGNPTFSGANLYTRRGDFDLDKNGYLVNGAGYYLEGLPIDPSTGNVSGSVPQVIQVSNKLLPALSTTKITYQLNLPDNPKVANAEDNVPGSELLRPADFMPVVPDTPATAKGATLNGTDLASSVMHAGDTLTVTVNGTDHTFTFYDSTVTSPAPANGIDMSDTAAPPVTISAALSALQTKLQADGGPLATATAGLDGSGKVTIALPSTDLTNSMTIADGTSGLGIGNTTVAPTGPAPTGPVATVSGADGDQFVDESIEGGAVTVYAPNGSPANVQFRWAKTDSADLGAGHSDTWNLFYLKDNGATGSQPMWQNVGVNYTFAADGSLNPPVESTQLNNLSINGLDLGNITLFHGTHGITQSYTDASGTVSTTALTQNGYAAGKFTSIGVDDSGRIVASYSNGEQIDVAQVVTADFKGVNALKRIDGGAFAETTESGSPSFDANPEISGSSLESSNTDISSEFSTLIVTQQAYAAGTKIVTTANDMLQQALNMIR